MQDFFEEIEAKRAEVEQHAYGGQGISLLWRESKLPRRNSKSHKKNLTVAEKVELAKQEAAKREREQQVRAVLDHGGSHFMPTIRAARKHTTIRKKRLTVKRAQLKQLEAFEKRGNSKKGGLSDTLYWLEQSTKVAANQKQDRNQMKETPLLRDKLNTMDDESITVQQRDNRALLQAITAYTQDHDMTTYDLFVMADDDGNGELDREEFR